MKRIAPELESLMWTLAEEGNERAIDEFGERHPDLRSELLTRMTMVKDLRGAKRKPAEAPKAIPRFTPTQPTSSAPGYVVGGLVLAAICALAFTATVLLSRPPRTTIVDPPISPPKQTQLDNPRWPNQPLVQNSPGTKLETTAPPEKEPNNELRPGTLKIEHAPLFTVLQMMSQVCGVRIEPAPGMPNPDVVVDYRDMTAMDMLTDLGRQYGFTPMDQNDGSIIVIPATDPKSAPQAGDPKGSFSTRKVGG